MASDVHDLLHFDLISLKPDDPSSHRETVLAGARNLKGIETVFGGGVIESAGGSDGDILLYFLIEGRADIEAFGADRRYVQFLQKTVAPVLAGLTGGDVRLDSAFPEPASFGACVALTAPPATYDWQVRKDLVDWTTASGATESATGLSFGTREVYRGLAIAFFDAMPALPAVPAGYGALSIAGRTMLLW